MKCTFFGHRDSPNSIRGKVKRTIEDLIFEGVNEFFVGNNGNFDYLVQSVLTEIIKEGKEINFTVVLSHIDEHALYADQKYTIFPEKLANTIPRFAICKRNDWLIDNSEIVVAYVHHNFSNSHKWLEKSKKKGLRVVEI